MSLMPLDISRCPLSGSNLIEASAGTGKTYTIAALFLRLIVEENVAVEQILVVTFTRAATQELRERLYGALQQARACFSGSQQQNPEPYLLYIRDHIDVSLAEKLLRVERALRDFDEAGIYTIHSFCQRMLVEHAFASSSLHDMEVTADQAQFIMDAVRDFWRQRVVTAPLEMMPTLLKHGLAGFLDLFRLKERNPELVIRGHDVSVSAAEISTAFKDLQQSCLELQRLFPDSVEEAVACLQLEKKILKNYRKDWLTGAAEKILAWRTSGAVTLDDALRGALHWFSVEKLQAKSKTGAIPQHPLFAMVSRVLTVHEHCVTLQNSFMVKLQQEMFGFVEARLATMKQEANLFAFNDFLVAMKERLSLSANGGELGRAIRYRFKAALIDEFQDTDPLQYAIFSTLFAKKSILFLIGDPKQAIYSFRGADIYAYLLAAHTVQRRYTLPTNYRSDATLVEAVNALFSSTISSNVFAEKEISFQPVEAHVHHSPLWIQEEESASLRIWCPGADQVAGKDVSGAEILSLTGQAIQGEISRLLALAEQGLATLRTDHGSRPLLPGDFAVLVRNKEQMSVVGQVLTEAGIPVVQSSSSSIFDSEEALFMELLLAALAEPGSLRRLKAVVANPIIGLTAQEMQAYDQHGWQHWSGVMRSCAELYQSRGFLGLFRALLAEHDMKAHVLSWVRGERCLTNLIHLAEIIHGHQQQKGGSLSVMQGWFAVQRADFLQRQDESELRMESDENAVQIVTIHKSKGLEYPIVFAPFGWGRSESRESLCHEQGRMTLFLDDAEFADHAKNALLESLSENLRLFYVALTRARHRCYTMWTKFGGHSKAHSSAPAYLFHNGADSLEQADPLAAMKKAYGLCPTVEAVATHLAALFAHESTIAIMPFPENARATAPQTPVALAQPLAPAIFQPDPRGSWQIASFSSLSRHGQARKSRDELSLQANLAEEMPTPQPSIHTFAKGAKAGTFFHGVLEHVDFMAVTSAQTTTLIHQGLQRYGFDVDSAPVVQAMLVRLMDQPLDGFTLSQISQEQRFNEMEFYFPLQQVGPPELARLFGTHAAQVADGLFATHAKGLTFAPCQGYLHGFIDLVFEQGGRYFLVDWKSNYLGESTSHYEQESLHLAMADSSYYLQYHLYTLALHLHLQATLAEYDYERHFGGVYYLFIRGIDPTEPGQRGVFYQRPSQGMVAEMGRVLTPDKTEVTA